MLVSESQVRVRYAEVDRMGYLHHSRYAQYYEVSRSEMLRELFGSYRDMEDSGIIMPLSDLKCHYHRPALYDDLLTVRTIVKEKPTVRMVFHYEVYNQDNILINTGETTLVFVDGQTRRPIRPPKAFMDAIEKHF